MEDGLWMWKGEDSYPEWIDVLVVAQGKAIGVRFDGQIDARSHNLLACQENCHKTKLWERLA